MAKRSQRRDRIRKVRILRKLYSTLKLSLRLIFFVFWFVLAFPVQAEPRQSLVPDGVVIILLDTGGPLDYRFRGKPVSVADIGGDTGALIGLPLSLKPGEH